MSLTFTQSISANQSFHGDPDFIITVDGVDITPLVTSWKLYDSEENIGEIVVVLINPKLQLGGCFGYGQRLEIRFGYNGQLSPKASVDVVRIEEQYPTGHVPLITITGRDDRCKLSGGAKRGNLKKGKGSDQLISGKEGIENAVKEAGLTPKITAPSDTKFRLFNYNNKNAIQTILEKAAGIGPE